ncbi:inositol monophosphatase family protein [Paenibacillus cellulositrophicus]|uniref:inositol monophosphatase family protein n=1 Tax=Paenibacillus cellulositrophicus TaxID=562959 RepID=UPI00142EF731|nr:inositol monophosphatase family protein [Paenibacillus cellulositrophicus]
MSNPYLQLLKEIVIELGKNSLLHLEGHLDAGLKGSHKELVTFVDRQNEHTAAQRIHESYPHHKIMGEESYSGDAFEQDDLVWVIDPIDGTTNYVHQKQSFAISIALYRNGQGLCGAVYDPVKEELFWAEKGSGAYLNNQRLWIHTESAELSRSLIATYIRYDQEEKELGLDRFVHQIANGSRGIRMTGCGSLELAYVACGRFDAYFSSYQKPWDFAAGKLLIEESGGTVTCLNGEPVKVYLPGTSILAAGKDLHQEILGISKAVLYF